MIELSIITFLNRLYVPKQVHVTAPKKELLIILPFLGTMPSNLKRKLQTSLFRFKDVTPKELRSHLVYKFSCSSYNATCYGKTERHLNGRSGEHIGLSPLPGNRVTCKPSATSDHLLLHEHNKSSFNNFSILCCENNTFNLSLRESILIKRDSSELNKNVSSMPLLLFN